jgi:hypothetical protein
VLDAPDSAPYALFMPVGKPVRATWFV